ncbi:hypothetical protein F4779DRAFT_577027 [Xylariaceae sp. FL0662B]|nr:hypothetical protein F4779DRAFT_577027 [Xylariaceae sp. FL0662B]
MSVEDVQRAAQAREQGNGFYRKGQLSKAMEAYTEAARLAPSDPSPLSNLSAAKFEAGDYAGCINAAGKALDLLDSLPNDVLRQRLLTRSARAYLIGSSLNRAEELLAKIDPGKGREELHDALRGSKEFEAHSPESALLRERLLKLPRLRPSMQDEPDYFGPGHDDVESQYTAALEKSTREDLVLSIMFCGVGDARHMFQTILRFASNKNNPQSLHFTILDLKPAVLARDLIFFTLLQEAISDQESSDLSLLTLSYLFCTQLIPRFVWRKLQKTISKLVPVLEKQQQPLDWAYLAVSQMGMVIKVLKSWQSGPATAYKTDLLRKLVAHQIAVAYPPEMSGFSGAPWNHFPSYRDDHQFFDDFTVMLPPAAALSKFVPELSTLVTELRSGDRTARKRISDHLDKSWKVNVTLIDVEWEAQKANTVNRFAEPPDMGYDPFEIVKMVAKLPLRKGTSDGELSVIKRMQDYFRKVGLSISSLQGRLTVEMIIGDMAEVLERARYGLLDRTNVEEDTTSKEWPQQYHIIHMSNIPDYVGGSLTSFLYGAPLLKQGTGSGLTSCVLRNPPQWKNHDHFNAEHLLMYDRSLIQKHFSLKLVKETPQLPFAMPFDFPMLAYHRWERCESPNYTVEQLMPRPSLSNWLFSHFLKLCLPFPRPQSGYTLVYAPLNMSVFLRLLDRMAELRYPGHWLSDIVTSLAAGEIITTARAPRKYVLTPAAVDKVYASRTINVKPWAAEFTTLTTMWRGLLPFGLMAPSKLLPPPETIAEYAITFPPIIDADLNFPHFMMVFWNARKYGEPPRNLRPLLLDDEDGDATTSAQKIRADGVRVLTTFTWVTKTNTATFWLRSDVVDAMVGEDWEVYIWRVDSWVRLTGDLSLRSAISRKRTWNEWMALTPK